jgi:Protein of unknown function (DUF4232)
MPLARPGIRTGVSTDANRRAAAGHWRYVHLHARRPGAGRPQAPLPTHDRHPPGADGRHGRDRGGAARGLRFVEHQPAGPATCREREQHPRSAVAGLATCQSASLTITVDDSQASSGAGSTYYPLDFTNTSATACQLYGYPGVSFVTAGTGAGQQVGQAAQRGDAFAKVTVRLAPGGTAHAWLKVAVAANYPASSCQPVTVHWLRIYPPGETAADYVAHTFSACSSSSAPLLAILPMRAGRGAQGTTP